jgi:hypothetical protein
VAWTASLNYASEACRKHDWRTDTINPFVRGNSAVYLGNDLKSYEAQAPVLVRRGLVAQEDVEE